MKRLSIALCVGTILMGAAAAYAPWLATLVFPDPNLSEAASPPESVDLSLPVMSPGVVTPNIATFVTLTSSIPNENINGPRLQFFDPAHGKWKTIKAMSDKGKGEDSLKGDREYNLRLRFLDSNGNTDIALPATKEGKEPKVKGTVPTPAQLRLAAKKKGHSGLVVSPTFTLPSARPLTVSLGTTDQMTLFVPQTIDIVDTQDPDNLIFTKNTTDGYRLNVHVRQNPGWLLEQWILACYFEPACNVLPPLDEAQTIRDRAPYATVRSTNISGLTGLHLELNELGGTTLLIFLDDQSRQRVIYFEVFPLGPNQDEHFNESAPEFLSIIESLIQ